ncbi:hypothetical protein EV126DRAFT_432185 [Verticillium dahliae]|nr:hypothetical protein EV126DRAFT_432185 [Verticillium dahliae]
MRPFLALTLRTWCLTSGRPWLRPFPFADAILGLVSQTDANNRWCALAIYCILQSPSGWRVFSFVPSSWRQQAHGITQQTQASCKSSICLTSPFRRPARPISETCRLTTVQRRGDKSPSSSRHQTALQDSQPRQQGYRCHCTYTAHHIER